MIKREKGITLVSLIITIALILIISSTVGYSSVKRFEINNLKKMKNDIALLQDKVSTYYLKYGGLPILREADGKGKLYNYTPIDFERNSADNENYYIIDLEAMSGISLNYGEEGFKNPNTSEDVYVINEATHTIYYVEGVEIGSEYHHYLNDEGIGENIAPTKPQIKVISGTKNHDGSYITEVELEFVPGNIEGNVANKTEFSIDSGNTWEDISTLTNNVYKITEDGSYNIIAKSYNENGNTSEYELNLTTAILRIGDKVVYNEGTGKISTVDSDFTMKDLEWRILNIEDDGTIKLISTQPTDDTLTISKTEECWLNGEENIDKLCDDLYGKGVGAISARGLKIEDINNLIRNFTPTYYVRKYGEWYYYKWDSTDSSAIKIKVSTDYNEETQEGTWRDTAYASFKIPGQSIIDSNIENYLDENGEERIIKLQTNFLYYNVEEKILSDLKTRDDILISQLITQGLNDANTATSGTNQKQWLSSKYVDCFEEYAEFGLLRTDGNGAVSDRTLCYSHGEELSGDYYYVVRPVVTLNSNISITFVNDEWQISE